MNFHNRLSASEVFSGVFRGEVSDLSGRVMCVHFVVVLLLSLLALFLYCKLIFDPYWAPEPGSNTAQIDQLACACPQYRESLMTLPYRYDPWEVPERPAEVGAFFEHSAYADSTLAVYIPFHFNAIEVSINGVELISSDRRSENILKMWQQSSLYIVPASVLFESENRLNIRHVSGDTVWMDISKAYIGVYADLKPLHRRAVFVSHCVLWLVLLGAIWAIVSIAALRSAGGSPFLLMKIPIVCLLAVHVGLQLLDAPIISPQWHLGFWLFNFISLIVLSAIVNFLRWYNHRVVVLLLLVVEIIVVLEVMTFSQGIYDIRVASWWIAFLLSFNLFLLIFFLLLSSLVQFIREGSRTPSPFLLQMALSRLLSLMCLGYFVLSMLGLFEPIPAVLLNASWLVMVFNTLLMAMMAGAVRAHRLDDFRENMQYKIAQEELRLWALNRHHKAAIRWAVVGQSGHSLLNEISPPLASINEDLAVLRCDPRYLSRARAVIRLQRCVDRCLKLVNVIEAVIKVTPVETRTVRLDDHLNGFIGRLQRRCSFQCKLHCEVRGWVEIDTDLLDDALERLVDNSLRACELAGRPLELELILERAAGELKLSVLDNGVGVEPGRDVFEPFQTTRAFGLGLGLSVAKKNLNAMGGRLSVLNSDRGACFCIHLPVGSVL